MKFELLDRYLLAGDPPKKSVVEALLKERPGGEGARPFYDGLRILGARTPDLSLAALRLVLAGKAAADADVVRLKELSERSRAGGPQGQEAADAYHALLGE